ncbi:hypothetical protein LXL04_003223 [Taraxacum kok-saghyz]
MEKSERSKASKGEDGADLISKIPDAIIILILSRLSSTEEQIRSSILSRRWRYLWTAIPSVDMEFVSEGKLKKCEFKEFVYWVLASKTVDLDRFRLFLNDSDIMSTVWRWVHLAVTRNVKQIDISFSTLKDTKPIELPHYLVSCGSLEVLRLDLKNQSLSLPRFLGFSALRVLDLTYVDLPEDGDLIKDFLKNCPLLEDLSLSCCFIGELVCISCPNLKRLSIVNWDDVGCHGFKICCPKLVDLELGGRILFGNTDPELFHEKSQFKLLWVHLYFSFESIDDACDLALPNLKTLGLKTTIGAFTFNELIQILKYYPKLEILKLTIFKDFDEECQWLDEAETRRLWTPDVKKVELFEFNGEKPKVVVNWCEGELEMGMKKSEPQKASKLEDGFDLIGSMPDAILILILSRLSSTEEQIRTSILSQRWRYLWTTIPSLRLQFSVDAACDLALPNLKTLLLRTTMEAFTVDDLIQILKYCPKLENLTLIIRKDFDEEYEWVDEDETRRIWTRDVKRVEFFKFNGERPKLDIEWCENELDLFLTFLWERGRASVKLL